MARACVRCAAAGVLLHLRGYSLQPDLVRHDDMALLLRHSRACLCENADGHSAEYAVVSHRRAVLCVRRIPAVPRERRWKHDLHRKHLHLHGISPAGGRSVHGQAAAPLLPVLHCRDGGVPAFGLYQHLPRGGMSGGRPCRPGGDRAGGGGNHEAAAAGILSSGIRAGGG